MMRRGVFRTVYSSMIDDPDYQLLSPHARLVLLTLRICTQAGAAVIFRAYVAVVAEQTGLDVPDVEKALGELACSPSAERPWIYREGSVIWIRNGLRFDASLRLADPKHRKSIERAVSALPNLSIVAKFCRYYGITSPFDGPGEGVGRPSDDLSPPSTETEVLPGTDTKTETEYRAASPNGHPPHGHGSPAEPRAQEVKLPQP